MTQLASPIVVAIEQAYACVRTLHPELPEHVMFLIGAGVAPAGYTQHGHYGPNRWAYKPEGKGKGKQVPEILITGECLRAGADKVMETLVHEAAHALAQVRKVKDTSRQGRYHNKRFLAVAEELGMEYTAERPDPVLGFSGVSLTPATADLYSTTVMMLAEAIKVANLPQFEEKETKARVVVAVVFEDGNEVELAKGTYDKISEYLLPHEAHHEER